jgi:hypothetical protein
MCFILLFIYLFIFFVVVVGIIDSIPTDYLMHVGLMINQELENDFCDHNGNKGGVLKAKAKSDVIEKLKNNSPSVAYNDVRTTAPLEPQVWIIHFINQSQKKKKKLKNKHSTIHDCYPSNRKPYISFFKKMSLSSFQISLPRISKWLGVQPELFERLQRENALKK